MWAYTVDVDANVGCRCVHCCVQSEARVAADDLEGLCDAKEWPLPSYHDMLFTGQRMRAVRQMLHTRSAPRSLRLCGIGVCLRVTEAGWEIVTL